jgi:hypothetical protein
VSHRDRFGELPRVRGARADRSSFVGDAIFSLIALPKVRLFDIARLWSVSGVCMDALRGREVAAGWQAVDTSKGPC